MRVYACMYVCMYAYVLEMNVLMQVNNQHAQVIYNIVRFRKNVSFGDLLREISCCDGL